LIGYTRHIGRKLAVLIFLLGTYTHSLCQNNNLIDSLNATLEISQDEDKVDAFLGLAWAYRKSDADSTIYYANKAIEIGRVLGLTNKVATAYNFLGLGYHYLGNDFESEKHYIMALEYSEEFQDSSQYAHAANNLGKYYLRSGDFVKAYEYYQLASNVFDKINDKDGLAFTYKGLSELFRFQNDFEKALEMSENAVRIRLQLGNTEDLVSSMIEHASVYDMLGQHKNALKEYLAAKSQSEIINDEIGIARINIGISEYYFKRGDYANAVSFGERALSLASNTRNASLITNINFDLGRAFFGLGDIGKAKSYFDLVLSKAELSRELVYERESYFYLSKISKKENNIQKAYEYLKKYDALKNKIDYDEAARKIQRIEIRADLENKEKENELLKANDLNNKELIKNQAIQSNVLMFIGFLVFCVALFLWYEVRRGKKRNVELRSKIVTISNQNEEVNSLKEDTEAKNEHLSFKNIELQELNAEKDNIMHVVAHDLRSPLNNVKGLSQILDYTDLKEDQRTLVSTMHQVAQGGINLITDLLDITSLQYGMKDVDITEVSTIDIINFTYESHAESADLKQIKLIRDKANIDVKLNSNENYLKRILDNLTSNAIKFSPKGGEVGLTSSEDDSNVYFSVKDNGPGFSEKDKEKMYEKFTRLSAQPTDGESSNGLGLAIIKTLCYSN